jgi:hypothetical protein
VLLIVQATLISAFSPATETRWFGDGDGQTPNKPYTKESLGCAPLGMPGNILPFVVSPVPITFTATTDPPFPMFYNCSKANALTSAMQAYIVNQNSLQLVLPAAAMAINQRYTVTVYPDMLCTTASMAVLYAKSEVLQPACLNATTQITFNTIAAPIITPINATAVDGTVLPIISLYPTANKNSSLNSFYITPSQTRIQIAMQTPIPTSNVYYVVFFAATDGITLKAALAANAGIGQSSWLGNPATAFTDRLVMHPNSSLPGRILSCTANTPTSLVCNLPSNITGSLWKLYLGWAVQLPDASSYAVHFATNGYALISSTGSPLSFSYFMPKFDPSLVRHFLLNANFQRAILPTFTGLVTDTGIDPGNFQCDPAVPKNAPCLGVAQLQAVTQVPDPIYFTGNFTPALGALKVYMGNPSTSLFFECIVQALSFPQYEFGFIDVNRIIMYFHMHF